MLSLYKGGFAATFNEKNDKYYYSIRSLSRQKPSEKMSQGDFQRFWDVLRKLKIVEQDMTLASLDYLMATTDENVIFRLHNISTRDDVPPSLSAILAEIVEKYIPDQERLVEKLRES